LKDLIYGKDEKASLPKNKSKIQVEPSNRPPEPQNDPQKID